MVNNATITGRLTKDPQLKRTNSGVAVCTLRIAWNRKYKSGGQQREETCFIDSVAWDKQAENASQYLSKGDMVTVEGSIQEDKWVDKEGKDRTVHVIRARSVHFHGGGSSKPKEPSQKATINHDDIPF